MQSRSERSSSNPECFKRKVALGSLCLGLLPSLASATLTATPVSPYSLTSSNIVHYQSSAGSPTMDTAAGFRAFNLSAAFPSSSTDEALLFDLTSTASFSVSGTQRLIVSAFVTMDSGDPIAIPLAVGQGALCATATGNCQDSVVVGATEYFRAVRSTSTSQVNTLRVGIFPADICLVANAVAPGIDATGCNAAALVAPSSGVPTQMVLQFAVAVVANDTAGFALSAASEKTDSITLSLTVDGSTLSCPSMASAYFPGDRSILTGEGFGATTGTGAAPVDTLVVIGNPAATNVDTSSAFGTANQVVGRIPIGVNSFVTGFTNTTDGVDNAFDVSFTLRDTSGRIGTGGFDVPGVGACAIENVRTAEIQGFLKQSKCFVATAAFESMDVPPVSLLREFRERRLRSRDWGRRFIAFYERHSPSAADWLIENPRLKPAVRVALLPVVAIAWVALHPREVLWAVTLLGVGTLILTWFVAFPPSRKRRVPWFWGVIVLGALMAQGLFAQTPSPAVSTPYLDTIREKIGDAPKGVEGSYTEREKARLGGNLSEGVSYTEELKKRLQEKEAKATGTPSYAEEQKRKIEEAQPLKSAIGAVADGTSELKARIEGDVHWGVSFKLGASIERTIQSTDASLTSQSFSGVYGSGWAPDLQISGEWQPFHSEWFGNIGLVAGGGVASFRGKGIFAINLTNPVNPSQAFGSESRTVFRYLMVPVWAGANYRFNLLRIVRPYVQGGAGVIGSSETREDTNERKSALSRAVFLSAGAAFWLNPILPKSLWDLYSTSGVKHYSLIVDYTRVLPMGSGVRIASQGISVGLLYEF
jgi:hypothetical protein